jgi:PilZ domain
LSKNLSKSSISVVPSAPAKPGTLLNTRRWPRHRLDVPIRVIVHSPERTKLYDGRGNELNEGGMAVTAGVELKVGREVAVEFTPPFTGLPIRVRGIVRNRTGYRYGVEFVMANPEETEQVDHLRSLLQTLTSISKE